MRLAQLAYRVIRNNMQNPPDGLSFQSFVQGDHDADPDYVSQISFAFEYIDRALQRLVSEKKTLLKILNIAPTEVGFIPFKNGKITSVFYRLPYGYERVYWNNAEGGIVVSGLRYKKEREPAEVSVEYRKDIPLFELEDIRKEGLGETGYPVTCENEIDLEGYGVTDEMCAYVIEYAEGMLMENVSPELSAKHLNYAETYFTRLETHHTDYPQTNVSRHGGLRC